MLDVGQDRLAYDHVHEALERLGSPASTVVRLKHFESLTFVEIGALVGGTEVPCDALVAGFGTVDGRRVIAAAEDFTVLGGSIGTGSMNKRFRVCELALQERVPLVFMLDGAGHLQKGAPVGGLLVSGESYRALSDTSCFESAGVSSKDGIETWVLKPERV